MSNRIEYEVLLGMRADKLIRLKMVSKSWYLTISCPKFQLAHFSKSFQSSILLKRDIIPEPIRFNCDFTFYPNPLNLSVPCLDIEFPYIEDHHRDAGLHFHGQSHGIVCVSDWFGRPYVWNPITGDVRQLPPTCLPNQTLTTSAIGFGYDQRSKQFKIVRVKTCIFDFYPPAAEIFELGQNNWRQISSSGFQLVLRNESAEMHYKGTCYWLARNVFDDMDGLVVVVLLSFDLGEEVFAHFLLPETLGSHDDNCIRTGILNESLILFHYPIKMCAAYKGVDLWKMEKDCVGVSWTKMFSIDPTFGINKPLAFFSFDELLMEEGNEGRVVLYSMKTKEVKKILFEGNPLVKYVTTIVIEPSLFSTMGNAMLIS